MASANHLMTVFLAVEMASVPSYVLAGILKGRRRASEAALKYAVYGAGAAGVMLYGISLLAGLLGTAHFPTIAAQLATEVPTMMAAESGGELMVLALAGLMIMVGLAFKLSAVPFHFWCPDVFEGASAEVDAFLSVASKAAAMALLVRVALGVSVAPPTQEVAHVNLVPAQMVAFQPDGETASATGDSGERGIRCRSRFKTRRTRPAPRPGPHLHRLPAGHRRRRHLHFRQPRRLRPNEHQAAARLFDDRPCRLHDDGRRRRGAAGRDQRSLGPRSRVCARLLSWRLRVHEPRRVRHRGVPPRRRSAAKRSADYAGLIRSVPVVAVALVTILVSLIGIPPLAGFIGKFAVFAALVDAGGPIMMSLLVIAGFNTVISLIYYLRVAKTVSIDPEPETRGPVTLGILPTAYVLIVAIPVLYYGLRPAWLLEVAQQATQHLFL